MNGTQAEQRPHGRELLTLGQPFGQEHVNGRADWIPTETSRSEVAAIEYHPTLLYVGDLVDGAGRGQRGGELGCAAGVGQPKHLVERIEG